MSVFVLHLRTTCTHFTFPSQYSVWIEMYNDRVKPLSKDPLARVPPQCSVVAGHGWVGHGVWVLLPPEFDPVRDVFLLKHALLLWMAVQNYRKS